MFNASMTMSKSFQYRSVQTNPWKNTIKVSDLCALVSNSCATASTGTTFAAFQPFFTTVRLKRIRIWQPYTTDATVNNLQPGVAAVTFHSGVAESAKKYMCQASTPTQSGYLDLRPPKNSAASFWHYYSTSDTMLEIEADGQAIVIIDVEGTLPVSGTLAPNWNSGSIPLVTGVVSGVPYYFPLDLDGYLHGHGPFLLPVAATEVVF